VSVLLAETWKITTYLAFPFVTVFALAAGLSVVVNMLSRERVLNPWLCGGLAMVCLAVAMVAYHFVMLYRLRGVEVH